MSKHLDEGTIQAFLDGELGGRLEEVSAHLEECGKCAVLLADAENEVETFNFAFAEEQNFAIPTQRIWARIENQIETIETLPLKEITTISAWQKIAQIFTFPRIALAGSCAVFLLGALIAFQLVSPKRSLVQSPNVVETIPTTEKPIIKYETKNVPEVAVNIPNTSKKFESVKPLVVKRNVDKQEVKVEKVNFSVETENRINQKTKDERQKTKDEKNPKSEIRNPTSEALVLPEEKGLLDTIARLQSAAKSNEDELTMRPSFRVEYEKNIALMDNAIEQLRKQARKNPKNDDAKQMLLASYRNKIDLLGTVAEKTQIIASLR